VRYLATLLRADDEAVLRWFILVVALLLNPAAVLLLLASARREGWNDLSCTGRVPTNTAGTKLAVSSGKLLDWWRSKVRQRISLTKEKQTELLKIYSAKFNRLNVEG
jgi:hypothetical protein